MGDEIKILNGRKYQKRGGQWFDIGPADESSTKIVGGRKYEKKDGQWFDLGVVSEEVKKKEPTEDPSLIGAAASLGGAEIGTQSTSQSSSTSSPSLQKRNEFGSITDKSVIDADIEREFVMSDPTLQAPDPSSPAYLGYLERKKQHEDRVNARKQEVKGSAEGLANFSKQRFLQIDADIQSAVDNQAGVSKAKAYGASGLTEVKDKEAQNEFTLRNYRNRLQSALAEEAVDKVVPKHIVEGSAIDVRSVGRDMIKIADPKTDALIDEAGSIPSIKQAELEKLGIDATRRYLQGLPQTEDTLSKIKQLDDAEATFAERNFDYTAQIAREKMAAAFYKRGNGGFWGYSEREMKEVVNDPSTGLTDAEKKVANDYVIPIEKKLFFSTDIPGSGFARSFKNAIDKGAMNSANTILGWAGGRDDSDRAFETLDSEVSGSKWRAPGDNPSLVAELNQLKNREKTGSLTQQEAKRKSELENYVSVRSNWSRFKDGVGDLTGQVAQIAFLTKGLGSAGKLMTAFGEGGGLLTGGLTRSAAGAALSNETVGLFLTSYLNAYDNYRVQALDMMPGKENAGKRDLYAKIMSGAEALSERIFNDVKVLDAFSKGIRPSIADITEKLINKEITGEIARKELQSTLSKNLKTFGKEYFKSTYQESFEEGIVDFAQGITDSVFTGSNFDLAKTGGQALNTFFTTALYSPVVASMAGKGAVNRQNAQDAYIKSAFVDMASNPSAYIKSAEDLLLNKQITQDQFNEKLRIINTARKGLAEIPASFSVAVDKDGEKSVVTKSLDYPEMSSFLIHKVNESILQEQADNTDDPVLKKNFEDQVKRSQQIRKGIIDGKIGITPDLNEVTDNEKSAGDLGILYSGRVMPEDLVGTKFEMARTAEESEKDAAKEVDPGKIVQATKGLTELVDNDLFSENMPAMEKEFAKRYPMSFLKTIADQVAGSEIPAVGEERSTEQQMIDRYGKPAVDLAIETFLFSEKINAEEITAEEDAEAAALEKQAADIEAGAAKSEADIELQKNQQIKMVAKPVFANNFELDGNRSEMALVQSKDRVKNIAEHDSIQSDLKNLEEVVNCIYE